MLIQKLHILVSKETRCSLNSSSLIYISLHGIGDTIQTFKQATMTGIFFHKGIQSLWHFDFEH